MQMIQKVSILQRQDNEKFNCIYNRVIGFRDDNMLKAGDAIKITNGDDKRVTIDADEPESRYACSSDLALALYLAHPKLPHEVAKALQSKLEKQDVYSLEDQIIAKANQILPTLDESQVRRTTASYSAPKKQPQRAPTNQRRQNLATPSKVPNRVPKKTEHHCSVCLKVPIAQTWPRVTL